MSVPNTPVWKLVDGGANMTYAVYSARVNLNQTGLIPTPVSVGAWNTAMLVVVKENSWATAIVEMKWQASVESVRYSMMPKAVVSSSMSPPSTGPIDITTIPQLTAEITTAEGSDAYADFRLCLAR